MNSCPFTHMFCLYAICRSICQVVYLSNLDKSNNPPKFTCLPRVRHLHLIELKTFVLTTLDILLCMCTYTHTHAYKCIYMTFIQILKHNRCRHSSQKLCLLLLCSIDYKEDVQYLLMDIQCRLLLTSLSVLL